MKEIRLSNGEVTMVDDDDYERLINYNWFLYKAKNKKCSYATRNQKNPHTTVRMHREIMNCPVGMTVDHIDNNGLNNQKNNLRICLNSENIRNQKKHKNNKQLYKGVFHINGYKKYGSHIRINNKLIHLGYFLTQKDAAIAYDKAAKIYHGDFANYNFTKGVPNEN